ncbi:hypothetical protein N7520_009101 [Penicillium odoratum]|uniref:uncharacterized protein n=1 Tax=Penicillium odoratum TaxID=1167516 RepID=UPI002547CCC6|nr:uncharacterized protein N7520_009101 [Penicillium odoratum]KAJ5752184.1 hypothetical protein N7520_009101 [Penicillium odoratum]
MATQESPFQCHFPGCGLGYRRKEHLTRHAKGHFQTQSFQCSCCHRVFARNDTLRQHVRTHHKTRELQYSRAIKACTRCRSRRSRCDGQSPCGMCSERGIACSYTRSLRSSALEQTTSQNGQAGPLPIKSDEHPSQLLEAAHIRQLEAIENSPCRNAPYVQAYFDKFHPHWPFLHPATFDPDHEPPFLTQSVVMMGAWAMGESSPQQIAKDLHERLTLSIERQRDKWDISTQHDDQLATSQSNPTPWSMATYQGILLHLIFSLLINPLDLQLTRLLPEIPSKLLIALVYTCLRRKMFFYPAIQSQFKPEDPQVLVWLGIEEVKRFNLSLYRVLVDPNILADAPGFDPMRGPRSSSGTSLLSLADMQFAMPDSDELWHATSGLAARIAGNMDAYSIDNEEGNWISSTARILEPSYERFQWV